MVTISLMACGIESMQNSGAPPGNAVNSMNDVRVGLAEDRNQHGGQAVSIARIADVLYRVQHLAHVRNPHGRSVLIGDDQRPVIAGREDLIVGAHFPGSVFVRKMAFGSVGVGCRKHAT